VNTYEVFRGSGGAATFTGTNTAAILNKKMRFASSDQKLKPLDELKARAHRARTIARTWMPLDGTVPLAAPNILKSDFSDLLSFQTTCLFLKAKPCP
jgi:hypothetical protein